MYEAAPMAEDDPMSNHIESPPPEVADHTEGGSGAGRPPLRRVHGVLGGVAAGIADYFNVEAWLIRLAFFLLVFAGGIGILLYLAGWLLIPEEGTDESIVEGWLQGVSSGPAWIGVALIVLAAIWILSSLNVAGSGLIVALALLGVGILLYRGEGTPREPRTPTEPPEAGNESAPATVRTRQTRQQRQRQRRPRQRSNLGRFTFAATLIGLGILALFDNAGILFPEPRHYFAVALAIVGAGLVVGAVWGRSRGLIAVGLILAFAVGIATIDSTVNAVQDRQVVVYTPQTAAQISSQYELSAGTLTIDLSDVPPTDFSFSADLGAGELNVILPRDIDATIDSRIGVGEFNVLGTTSQGLGVGRTVHIDGTNGSARIDLNVGAGKITVTQEGN